LPADLPAPPVYAKVNPADAPVLTLAISSDTLPLTEVQNLVDTRLAQKISQVTGVGQVSQSGGQRPAVRIQVDTQALASYGLALSNVQSAISAANAGPAAKPMYESEKCFGIAASGSNDCQTATNSCAGTVTTAMQGDAWIYVPTGVCGKIGGGSLEPKKS
jgi:multidrug efflux pump subunit AcrB